MAALKVSVKMMGVFIENLFVMIIFLYTNMINNYCRYMPSFSAIAFKPFDAKNRIHHSNLVRRSLPNKYKRPSFPVMISFISTLEISKVFLPYKIVNALISIKSF